MADYLSNAISTELDGFTNLYPDKPITELVENGVFEVNHEWIVKYWNKAAEKLLGVKAQDIMGINLREKFMGVIPLDFYDVNERAYLEDLPIHFKEYWGQLGGWFDFVTYHLDDTLTVSFKSVNKNVQGVIADSQFKVLNSLYKFVTEVTNDCLWEWDIQSKEIFWIDGGHKRILGYQIENTAITEKFWESRLHPDDKERVITRFNKIVREEKGKIWEDEYRFKRANDEYAYVHDRGCIIYDEHKIASRMIGATQDITSRKLTELQLLNSERKLSLIARQTVSAVIITDAEEIITWVNNAFTKMTEYEPGEAIGIPFSVFLHDKDSDPETIKYVDQKIKDKESFDCDIINHSKSGRMYWMHLQGQASLDENENLERYFVIATNITEKILLQNTLTQERLKGQKELTDAVLTALDNERAEIGKELHDNVNQILGATMLYLGMAKTNEENREKYIDKSSDYIKDVIAEIRRISETLIPPGMHDIGLGQSMRNLFADLKAVQSMEIEFQEEGIADFNLDEKLQLNIFRIVQEQFNNILKHSNATNTVVHLRKNANEIILIISDNGQGFDTSTRSKGVGIRNIMSRAEFYHGRVTVTSKPGEGYELKVILPLLTVSESAEAEK